MYQLIQKDVTKTGRKKNKLKDIKGKYFIYLTEKKSYYENQYLWTQNERLFKVRNAL